MPSSPPSAAPSGAAAFPVPGTFFPHLLLDEVMPTLSGSEWALLCVVVRQTLGWHDPSTGGRKRSDWLSHRQLKSRTGRGSDAVCSAVDSLVRRGLIEVRDEAGHLLLTPAERRRARRLFYALSRSLLTRLQAEQQPEPEFFGKPDTEAPSGRPDVPKEPSAIPATRFRKAETTKETGTKYRQSSFGKAESEPPLRGRPSSEAVRPEGRGCGCLRPLAPPPPAGPAPAPPRLDPPRPDLVPFLRLYREKLGQRGNSPEEMGAMTSEDRARLHAALDRYGPERLEQLAELFFESESALLHRRGYGLGPFLEVVPTLSILGLKSARPARQQSLGAEPTAGEGHARHGE